jgi:hypothetical protein
LGAKNLFCKKPNPSRDDDGKPRVLIFPVDPFLKGFLFLKDSRAAECDIVKSHPVWFGFFLALQIQDRDGKDVQMV